MSQLFWDLAYLLGVAPWDTGIVPPQVRRLVAEPGLASPVRVLDLGCGTGTNALFLAHHGHWVVGVDISPVAVRRARQRIRQSGLSRCQAFVGDVTCLHRPGSPVDGQFDVVLDVGCYHGLSLAGRASYAAMLAAMLKGGGRFLLYAHLPPVGGKVLPRSGPWHQRLRQDVARLVGRRPIVPRPTRAEVEATFGAFCELADFEPGEDRGRPAAWYWWRRAAS